MSSSDTGRAGPPNLGVAIWTCTGALVALRAISVLLPPGLFWGLNVVRYLDPWSGWGLWGLGALSLIPMLARPISLERVGDFVVDSRRAPWIVGGGAALLALVMPDRTWFVGDFLQRLGNVESNFFGSNYWGALPLDTFLHFILLRPIGFGSQEAANTALRLLGAVEAGILGAMSVAFCRVVKLHGSGAVVATTTVIFGGYLTMFTGLGKPASEMCLVVLGLGITGLQAVRGRGSLLPLGLTTATGFLLHRSSVAFIPWLLVVVRAAWRARGSFGWRDWVAIAVALAAAAVTFPYIVSFALRYDVSHHILTAATQRRGLLPFAFSGEHLQGLANLLTVLSPLWVLGVMALIMRAPALRNSEGRTLGLLALSFLPLMLFIQPQHGLFRDWDVFAPAGMALSMWTACALQAPPERGTWRWLALPLALGAMIPSLQWLLLNREPSAGLARVRTYLLTDQGPSDLERALTWDFLTARYLRLSLWKEAADAGSHAAALAPHTRILLMWALAETMKPDDVAAERVYQQLLAREPDHPLGWLGMAGAAARLGQPDLYKRAAAKLDSFQSDSVAMAEIRRHLEHYPQVWSGARK